MTLNDHFLLLVKAAYASKIVYAIKLRVLKSRN